MIMPLLASIVLWIAIVALIVRDCIRAEQRHRDRHHAVRLAATRELERVCAEWSKRRQAAVEKSGKQR